MVHKAPKQRLFPLGAHTYTTTATVVVLSSVTFKNVNEMHHETQNIW